MEDPTIGSLHLESHKVSSILLKSHWIPTGSYHRNESSGNRTMSMYITRETTILTECIFAVDTAKVHFVKMLVSVFICIDNV